MHADARASAQEPIQLTVWTRELVDALEAWEAFPSAQLLHSDGLEVFARRSKTLAQKSATHPEILLSHMPDDPSKLATGSSGIISIVDLVQRHRGEVRQLVKGAYWSLWEKQN